MIPNETSGGISLLSFLPKSYQLGYKVLVWNDSKAFFSSVFSMNASPIKSKVSRTADSYWKNILELENLMTSKVYTYSSESVRRSLGIHYLMCIPRIHKILAVNYNYLPC